MSSWKRGFLEIIGEILESLVSSPLKKTHITFRCNLDSRAVSKYLMILMHVGLVEISKKDPACYIITQKGISYRNQFKSFMSMMERDMQSLDIKNISHRGLMADLKIKMN